MSAAEHWDKVRAPCLELHIAFFVNRPKDVQGCPAAPEEFSFTAFVALFLFAVLIVCVCVCVVVCVYVCGCVCGDDSVVLQEGA